jgi:hypothetical protein
VSQSLTLDSNVQDIQSLDEMVGRLYIGDISSDGFPDLLVTLRYINGSSRSHVLLNEPCSTREDSQCTAKA